MINFTIVTVACTLAIFTVAVSAFEHQQIYKRAKLGASGNGCPESSPWPCKTPGKCLSFDYICDGEGDCPDGYDEDPELCTAKSRPAINTLGNFIEAFRNWLIPDYLGKGTAKQIAIHLTESKTIQDYEKIMNLTEDQKEGLNKMMDAVKNGRQVELILMGMPVRAWNDLYMLFGRIIESGFLGKEQK